MADEDVQPLLFDELARARGVHVPDEVSALASLDARVTVLDAQSVAYRSMGPGDVVLDGEIAAMAERVHPPYVPGADVRPASVEEYEAARWDADRLDPREHGGPG